MLSADYVAGLFDGEGSLSIIVSHRTQKTGRKRIQHQLAVTITNTHYNILHLIREQFKGHVGMHSRPGTNPLSKKVCWRWAASSRTAEQFLRIIEPHLIIKKEQAIIGLQLQALMRDFGGRFQPGQMKGKPRWRPETCQITEEEFAKREQLRANLLASKH